jgi:low affinity Fe/Cu permease
MSGGDRTVGNRREAQLAEIWKPAGSRDAFTKLAGWVAAAAGKPATFAIASIGIIIWAAAGPFFGFSETWQLIVNTTTTIITFLMVFVIQDSQNRDTAALQIKLDELIRVTARAENRLLDLEELSAEELERMRGAFEQLARAVKAVEHYEMSRYESLIMLAEGLGMEDAASLLEQNLTEEQETDKLLEEFGGELLKQAA